MPSTTAQRTRRLGWAIGGLAAILTYIVLWNVALGLYTSLPGLFIASFLAFAVGTTAATLIHPRLEENAGAVAFIILVIGAAYLLLPTNLPPGSDARPGVRGGPAVFR